MIQHQHGNRRRIGCRQPVLHQLQLLRQRVTLAQPCQHPAVIAGRLATGCKLGLGDEHLELLPEGCRSLHITLQCTFQPCTGTLERVGPIEHGEAVAADEAGFKKMLVDAVPRNEDHRAATKDRDHTGHRPFVGIKHLGLAQQHCQLG